MAVDTSRRFGLYIVLLAALLIASVLLLGRGEDAPRSRWTTRPTLRSAPADWRRLPKPVRWMCPSTGTTQAGATYYKVYWRVAGPGNPLNAGVEVQSSDASDNRRGLWRVGGARGGLQ